jgi:hypothetical protein
LLSSIVVFLTVFFVLKLENRIVKQKKGNLKVLSLLIIWLYSHFFYSIFLFFNNGLMNIYLLNREGNFFYELSKVYVSFCNENTNWFYIIVLLLCIIISVVISYRSLKNVQNNK